MSQTPRHLWRIVKGDPCAAKVSKTSSERHGNKFSDWFSVLASSPATTRASCTSLAALVSSRMQEAIKSSAASKFWPSTHTSAKHRPSDEPSARGFSLTSSSPLATFATVQMHRPYPDTSHTSRQPWLASRSLAERALIHWWTCSRVQEKQQVAKKVPPIHSFEYVRRKKTNAVVLSQGGWGKAILVFSCTTNASWKVLLFVAHAKRKNYQKNGQLEIPHVCLWICAGR